jgi:hypothetical protein
MQSPMPKQVTHIMENSFEGGKVGAADSLGQPWMAGVPVPPSNAGTE